MLSVLSSNDSDMLIALAGIFFVFGFPVLAWLIHRTLAFRERQMKYEERIELIRHGINPGAEPGGPVGSADEWRTWAGFPQGSRSAGHPTVSPAAAASAQLEMNRGLIMIAVGLAITVGLSFIGNGPWLIGGLVPLFIGVARVVIALTSGAQMRFGPPPYIPPPPQAPPNETKNVTYEGSYTYRPGSTQELRPPTPPPTTRDH